MNVAVYNFLYALAVTYYLDTLLTRAYGKTSLYIHLICNLFSSIVIMNIFYEELLMREFLYFSSLLFIICFLYKDRLLWRMVVLVILMLMVHILEIPLDLYVINCTTYSPEVFLQQYPLTMPLLGLWNFIGLWLVSYFLRKRRHAVLHINVYLTVLLLSYFLLIFFIPLLIYLQDFLKAQSPILLMMEILLLWLNHYVLKKYYDSTLQIKRMQSNTQVMLEEVEQMKEYKMEYNQILRHDLKNQLAALELMCRKDNTTKRREDE